MLRTFLIALIGLGLTASLATAQEKGGDKKPAEKGAKADENDAALSRRDLDERGAFLQHIAALEVAAPGDVPFVVRIAGHDRTREARVGHARLVGRGIGEVGGFLGGDTYYYRPEVSYSMFRPVTTASLPRPWTILS